MDRLAIVESVTEYTCSRNCYGLRGNSGACCGLADRDWIIGPLHDAEAFIERLSTHLGRPVDAEEALIDADEGMALFPLRAMWQNRANYPAMRIDPGTANLTCVYYDPAKGCTIHAVRPSICHGYSCEHLGRVLDLL